MPFTVELRQLATEEYIWAIGHRPDYAKNIDELLNALTADPFRGIGKPEPLKYGLHGFWSRRVTKEHRLVYQVIPTCNQTIACWYEAAGTDARRMELKFANS